jgi:DNA-binding SARP family transcriptional activator
MRQGMADAVTDPARGRATLAHAYSRFEALDDASGLLLTCAEILHTLSYAEGEDLALGDPWAAAYARLLGSDPAATLSRIPDTAAGRVIAAARILGLRDPAHPLLPQLATLGERYGAKPMPSDARISAFVFPTLYWTWCGDLKRALRCAERAISLNTTSRASLLELLCLRSIILSQQAEHEAAFETHDRAQALAAETGAVIMHGNLLVQRAFTALSAGDLQQVEGLLRQVEADPAHGRTGISALVSMCRAGLLLLSGELRAARELLQECMPLVERAGNPFDAATARVQLGQALMLEERHEEAREELERVLELARAVSSDILAFRALISLSYSYLRDRNHAGRSQGFQCLRDALAIGKRRDYGNCHPVWIPAIMSLVFSRALEAEIEPEYVRRFIERRGVEPEGSDVPRWPWPLRVYTLQMFDVLKRDRPLRAGSKTPRRVFELLQAIVALGPRKVACDRLVDTLWPQSEGEAARNAFDVTLHRLRKLLGDDAVLVERGHVALAGNRVWIDVEAFERLTEDARLSSLETDESAVARHVEKALTLYAGHFLRNERQQPWMLPTRERLRSRLERLVTWAGAYWEERGDLAQARTLYERALELDPRAASFYRRLAACHEGAS